MLEVRFLIIKSELFNSIINKAVVISDSRKSPYHIDISSYVYKNLTNRAKYAVSKNIFDMDTQVDMWTPSSITYITSYYWSVD